MKSSSVVIQTKVLQENFPVILLRVLSVLKTKFGIFLEFLFSVPLEGKQLAVHQFFGAIVVYRYNKCKISPSNSKN